MLATVWWLPLTVPAGGHPFSALWLYVFQHEFPHFSDLSSKTSGHPPSPTATRSPTLAPTCPFARSSKSYSVVYDCISSQNYLQNYTVTVVKSSC